jgi:hypothetical protein
MGEMWGQKGRRTSLARKAVTGWRGGSVCRTLKYGGAIGAILLGWGHAWPAAIISGIIAFLAYILQPYADDSYVQNSDDTFTANLYKNHMQVSQHTAERMARRKNALK